MRKITVDGKTIVTNYGNDYSINTAQNSKTLRLCVPDFGETEKEFFYRLVSYGYTHITFYYDTTRIRGLYDLFAYCK